LIGCTTHATRLHFNSRRDVSKCFLYKVKRIGILLTNHFHRTIDDALGNGLLATLHDHIDEASNHLAAVLRIGENCARSGGTFTGHDANLNL